VPPVIDEAYVQRVLTALYDLESEAVRQMVTAGEVTGEAEAIVRAIGRPDLVERELDSYRADAEQGFPGAQLPPGNQQVQLEELISADPSCVFARMTRDFSQVLLDPSSQSGPTFVQLLPESEGEDPSGKNLTPWIVGGTLLVANGEVPENPCVAS